MSPLQTCIRAIWVGATLISLALSLSACASAPKPDVGTEAELFILTQRIEKLEQAFVPVGELVTAHEDALVKASRRIEELEALVKALTQFEVTDESR